MSREEQMKQAFLEEASDLLPELEDALLSLEDSPQDIELINRVFRALHTLKGSGNMFGYENIGRLSHEIETIFDKIRSDELDITKQIVDVTFRTKDQIQQMLYSSEEGQDSIIDNLIQEIKHLAPGQEAKEEQDISENKPSRASGENLRIYRIRFKPPRDIFHTGTDPLSLLSELQELGSAYIVAHIEDLPDLEDIEPEKCYTCRHHGK